MFRPKRSLLVAIVGLACASAAAGFTYVADGNGTYWGIQDAAPPGVDTGSIRATQTAAGQNGAFSTTMNGYGGIRVRVETTPEPAFSGDVMRGFGLQFDGADRFRTTQSVALGAVLISRNIFINRQANWGRWLDTFTNTGHTPLTIEVAFGGQTGSGGSGPNSSALMKTTSGGAEIAAGDRWVVYATPPSEGGGPAARRGGRGPALRAGPQATVTGRFTATGDWLDDPFYTPLAYSGHARNFPAFVNRLTIPPAASRSLLHFIVAGERVTAATAEAEINAVAAGAAQLAQAPDVRGLSAVEVCSIANFDLGGADCGRPGMRRVPQPPAPKPRPLARPPYDVVGKTMATLQHDMERGATTSEQVTQGYLARIAALDRGQFGYHAYEIVAADALQQARAADAARRAGKRGPLLGIPVAIKNLYDTRDMATTDGSLTFAGFRPARDAFQVARLRAAGAVVLGKAAMEEYATSGFYSNDAWGQVWSFSDRSRSPLGSSGGSAVAVAASLAAAALGTQTGDSLYGPASAEGLVALRGTDGLESGSGIMPLVWMTDFGGVLARTVPDLAAMLNVVTGTDPDDPATAATDAHIPKDWRTALDPQALRGKRIGLIASTWVDPFGTTETVDAEKAALQYFVAAGATIVPMGTEAGGTDAPPRTPDTSTGDVVSEGWMQYLDRHPELAAQGFAIHSAVDVNCSQKKIAYTRLDPSACAAAPSPRMTAAEIQAKRDYRHSRQAVVKAWMDTAGADHQGVDAIVYPGLLSEISVNDGGGTRASFGRRDTPSAANGVPTVIFPAGHDAHGQPVDIQLLGRAWDDAKLVGMAYAFELKARPGRPQ